MALLIIPIYVYPINSTKFVAIATSLKTVDVSVHNFECNEINTILEVYNFFDNLYNSFYEDFSIITETN